MISMTGFGRAQGAVDATGNRQVVVEIRSVNHRALDVKVRGRNLPAALEVEIIRAVRAAVTRGSVQVSIDEAPGREPADAEPGGALPIERIRATQQALDRLRQELGLPQPVDLGTVASFLRLDRDRPGDQPGLDWPGLSPVFAQALAAMQRSRAEEGAALATELETRARRLDQLAVELGLKTAGLPARAQQRLQERLDLGLRSLAGGAGLEPGRLAQEAALLADRLDVTEELARLEAHRLRLHQLLQAPPAREGVGRTLEFLLQELGRELNTLGAKSQDAGVSTVVIAAKAELEKIREQAQNIE